MDWSEVVERLHSRQVQVFLAAFGLLLLVTLCGC